MVGDPEPEILGPEPDTALKATQGQMDFSLVYPHTNATSIEVASVGDCLEICPQLDSRVDPHLSPDGGGGWQFIRRLKVVNRVLSSLLGPVDLSFRALSGRLKFTVRGKDSFAL